MTKKNYLKKYSFGSVFFFLSAVIRACRALSHAIIFCIIAFRYVWRLNTHVGPMIIAGTSYWVIIDGGPSGIHMNHTRVTYLHGHMGLFRMCRSVVRHSWLGGRPSSEGAQGRPSP